MIVSWNWLAQYVRLDMPVDILTERFALTGLNHESTSEVGGDLAIDLEVTSNRADCLGHLGVAREVSVLFDRTLAVLDPRPPESGPAVTTRTGVTVDDPALCSQFTARVISGVKVGESPWWLRKRLETIGVRPISNIVDITNYVMFECGQPLHAYDLDRLEGRRLVVRRARKGETLTAINNKVYELTPEMLVIADAERPVGLAGVMGGLDTEIGATTANVLIEAARFDSMSIRRTARALGLHSPSSYRFERPLDPERTEWASRRCAELILELAGGTLHPGLIDVSTPLPARSSIKLRYAQIPRVLGIDVPQPRVEAILQDLGLEARGGTSDWREFQPPSWRSDLEREIDLIEEVARIHGYEHIPENRLVPLASSPRGLRERVETEIRGALTACGFDEAVTFSLVSDELSEPLDPGSESSPIRVDHSSRKRENALRRSLVPSLLAVRRHNEAYGNPDAELFEIANVYRPRSGSVLPEEPTRLSLVSGRDYLGLKGVVEALLARLHADHDLEVRPVALPYFAPGRGAELLLGGTHLGYLGEVDPTRLTALELRGASSAVELELDVLMAKAILVPLHHPLPPFPAVMRDLSLVVARSLAWSELARAVRDVAGPTLEAVLYLDTFRGGNLDNDRQSLHFGLRFRHPARTLTGEEVEQAIQTVIAACADRFGATLRT
ncbi:phenylalanine--tRNA ligase subunit beta [Singulisphaera acidiphila]|uniref:Phenylalanine--tRNA ligase beta subunit n=1 Tax=Singulisphaera acidiphila (strain ATCC BAA-1392 / DSM 18658 / VKM B-2454 / MOB10) TaxID=886293 RepID=L0D851_SINAD|nr:phenylalanine--tRNA ligase subunit beta [Singulisphaera acidiphila]AGA25392.1 phenylalanyl-tRNA synthetase, beta subunit [Singulisphaera acidiphila DSM 18658]